MTTQPVATLRSRTFIGLLLAQFTATFNDQAIHIVAIFYATNLLVRYARVSWCDEKTVLSLVTVCFLLPFLVFSPIAGVLADKFSKRTIIVFWKLVEVVLMLVALIGLSLPHFAGSWSPTTLAVVASAMVVSTTFLMGLHSTFFVPAKYGVMPEILHTTVLSRGNGLLEGTSFMAQIFGTAFGGTLYVLCQSEVSAGKLVPGQEWVIGVLLFVLALIGTLTSFLMQPLAAADPNRKISKNLWQPAVKNFAIARASRPLMLSIIGIAFAAFLTIFLRQILFYQGEVSKELQATRHRIAVIEHPEAESQSAETSILGWHVSTLSPEERAELRVALLIAMVGFGIGLGSLAAGYLSGHKVELGLVPIGAVGMITFGAVPSLPLPAEWIASVCLFLIGVSAGFYIVPLYTLLQKRAPRKAKGNVIAISNFINVIGGILAVLIFWGLTLGLETLQGQTRHGGMSATATVDVLQTQALQLKEQLRIPRFLFLFGSAFTVMVLFVLCRHLPDFFVRSLLWLRSQGRYHLHVQGLQHLPSDGPVILATNCERIEDALLVVSATDRYVRFLVVEGPDDPRANSWLRYLSRSTDLIALRSGSSDDAAWTQAEFAGMQTLRENDVVAITITDSGAEPIAERVWQSLRSANPKALLLPVLCVHRGDVDGTTSDDLRGNHVVLGEPLPADADWNAIRAAIESLRQKA